MGRNSRKLVASAIASWIRKLEPLKTRLVERIKHVKYVVPLRPPKGVVWKVDEAMRSQNSSFSIAYGSIF
ncbi:hypothetical protein TNCV_271751 [Trichonephila clavipes]|nr:hypothetical protein TNCV_271751 [Trichonephila clavipes]